MASSQADAAVTVMFGDGVRATVSVKLIYGDQKDPVDVYGTITAGTHSVLFDKKQYEAVPVRPGEFIPLIGHQIDLPPDTTSLEITVNLMDYYDEHSPGHEIANGSPTFPVKPAGETKTPVTGEYGSVEVFVVWG